MQKHAIYEKIFLYLWYCCGINLPVHVIMKRNHTNMLIGNVVALFIGQTISMRIKQCEGLFIVLILDTISNHFIIPFI